MFDLFDVVRVPFPFSDLTGFKTRPALVISSAAAFNDTAALMVAAMITSAHYSTFPLDVLLRYPSEAGLLKPSVVRMKLFTVDCGLALEHLGTLVRSDRQRVMLSLRKLIPFHDA